ncbi:hypothetical protein BKH41_01955 [Helicobacter sp. 12S02232-10]|uniref:hypothetical protein n=1 Tax=Helicobacter sp. 12S02232-10 TaxID=1476197 RepID=UPI000BA74562|nr:hypothetical protein [Helicobacter sp. 12S02232-10]PAF49451.1 hypothetical protein BKH41_01955 [Helicobacter sp. 12S02232-10]
MFDASIFYNYTRDKKLLNFFAGSLNSKIFVFYQYLIIEFLDYLESATVKTGTFLIQKQDKSFRFNVTKKTIKNWLFFLQEMGFIRYEYLNFDCVKITLLDYRKIPALNPPTHKENGEEILPSRFYKNIQLILAKVVKDFDGKTLSIEGGEFEVTDFRDKKDLSAMQNVFLRFKDKQNECFETIISYEMLTGKALPSIKCSYHQAIIKKRITTALNNYIVSPPPIPENSDNGSEVQEFQKLKIS